MTARSEQDTFEWSGSTISAVWDHPASGDTYIVLGHGAGGNLRTPGLAGFAQMLAARGIGAVRFNFPYAEARRKVPDRQATLETCYRAVAGQVGLRAGRVMLGGRSMGGRIASHIVAGGVPAAGLVFLSYPLHPPGQPERLRDRHLPGIVTPMLFIQGSRDAFARPDLLEQTLRKLKNATVRIVEGGDHGLRVRGRAEAEVIGEIAGCAVDWIRGL